MSVEGEIQLEVYADTVEGTTAIRKVHVDTVEGIAAVKNNFAKITLYALLGNPSPGTMRILGRIKHKEVVILIDSGSTHNFLDVYTWSALALPLSIGNTFEVKVANGAIPKTRGVCYGVSIKTQRYLFQVDVNVLPLGNCAVVLGT